MCLAINTEKGQQEPLTENSYYHIELLETWMQMSKKKKAKPNKINWEKKSINGPYPW